MGVLTGLWYLFVLSLPFLFLLGLIVSVLAMGIRRAGWGRLAAAYRYDLEFPPMRRRLWNCHIGWKRYEGIFSCAVDEGALYLRASFMFVPLAPPIRVPWSAVRLVKAPSFLSSPKMELHTADGPPIRVALRGVAWSWIRDARDRAMRAAA